MPSPSVCSIFSFVNGHLYTEVASDVCDDGKTHSVDGDVDGKQFIIMNDFEPCGFLKRRAIFDIAQWLADQVLFCDRTSFL